MTCISYRPKEQMFSDYWLIIKTGKKISKIFKINGNQVGTIFLQWLTHKIHNDLL